jgi:galactokinase/mevalonate kinase-like predicted kinase
VAIRYGKNVVLKNKILRKQMNERMEIDKDFVRKTEKLMALAEKFTNKTKRATIQRFNEKLNQL